MHDGCRPAVLAIGDGDGDSDQRRYEVFYASLYICVVVYTGVVSI